MARDNSIKATFENLQKGETEANQVISSELNLALEELKLLVERGQKEAALRGITKLQEAINLLMVGVSYSAAIRHRLELEILDSRPPSGIPQFQA